MGCPQWPKVQWHGSMANGPCLNGYGAYFGFQVVISPQPGSTNSSESLHHIIKQEVERKETKFYILIKTIIDDQICQNEKAVINQGEWCFAQEYSTLVISNYPIKGGFLRCLIRLRNYI